MIDYKLLQQSVEYYEAKGYQRIEVPWLVTEAIDSITRPSFAKGLSVPIKNKNLIASGEQGFLYLILKGFLPPGKYQAITPCFRDDTYDLTHSKFFMKNELINTLDTSKNSLDEIVEDAMGFYKSVFPVVEFGKNPRSATHLYDAHTDEGIDIYHQEHELGSYGIRSHFHLKWVYGTGCAEPRTSRLIKVCNGLS